MWNPFKRKQKKALKIAIGAIFRNELEYIDEWIAWHQSQGIHDFIIFDNQSNDGTSEKLQQLAQKGVIRFHSIEAKEKAQIEAYHYIIDHYGKAYDLIAFIDADEFIVSENEDTASQNLQRLFQESDVGAIGLNWRVMGTSGHQARQNGHILDNFKLAASDTRLRNHYLKSIYRPDAVIKLFPHRAIIKPDYRYLNCDLDVIRFATINQGQMIPTLNNQTTGVSQTICQSGLRVHHYALKSVDEYLEKKKFKGSVMFGSDHVKSDGYFREFDLNDFEYKINPKHLEAFYEKFQELKALR